MRPRGKEIIARDDEMDTVPNQSRRRFFAGVRKTAELALLSSVAGTVLNSVEGAGFIVDAPHYEHRRACKTVAHFGDIGSLVSNQPCFCYDIGDSITRGCNDFNWYWAGIAQLIARDMNRVCAAAGVPLPERITDPEAPYLQHKMLAHGGWTIEQIRRYEIAGFDPDAARAPLSIISGGGDDALQYIARNVIPIMLGNYVPAFQDGFQPTYKRACQSMLEELVARCEKSPIAQPHLFVVGVPNIGNSTLFWPLRIPGVRQLATATCQYMNNDTLDCIDDIQRYTRVQLHFQDIFTDINGRPLALGGVHPVRPEYVSIDEMIKDRCIGDFPDGTRSFLAEQTIHQILPRGAV